VCVYTRRSRRAEERRGETCQLPEASVYAQDESLVTYVPCRMHCCLRQALGLPPPWLACMLDTCQRRRRRVLVRVQNISVPVIHPSIHSSFLHPFSMNDDSMSE